MSLSNYHPLGNPNGVSLNSLEAGLVRFARQAADSRGAVSQLRAAAPMPVDSQRLIDRAVVGVGLDRLQIVKDLLAANLTFDLANWLSVLTLYHEKTGRAGRARRTMIPKARGERFVLQREGVTTPIYITWSDFSSGAREKAAAERAGAPLDVTHAEESTRQVNEAFEDQAINGIPFSVDGNTVYGFLNHPDANTISYVGNEAWDNAGHTGEEILQDTLAMIGALQAVRRFGPYHLWLPTTYGNKLNQDFKANGDKSILTRMRELDAGGTPLTVSVADQLPANRTIMSQMTKDVVDVIVGQQPTQVSWTDGPGWEEFFCILGVIIVRIKVDYDGNTGFVIGNTT